MILNINWISAPILSFVITITSCGYHLRDSTGKIPDEIKNITLKSYDPYDPLTRAIRTELFLNGIILADYKKNQNNMSTELNIIKSSTKQVIKSILQNGQTAEYQIILIIHAQIHIPKKKYYYIDVKVCHVFFHESLTALANDVRNDILKQEMYKLAAQQLVRKLFISLTNIMKKDALTSIEKNNKVVF